MAAPRNPNDGKLIDIADYTTNFVSWQSQGIAQVAADSPSIVKTATTVGHVMAGLSGVAAIYHYAFEKQQFWPVALVNGVVQTAVGSLAGLAAGAVTEGAATVPVDLATQFAWQKAVDNIIDHWDDPVRSVVVGYGRGSAHIEYRVDPSSPYYTPYTNAALANKPPSVSAAAWANLINEISIQGRNNIPQPDLFTSNNPADILATGRPYVPAPISPFDPSNEYLPGQYLDNGEPFPNPYYHSQSKSDPAGPTPTFAGVQSLAGHATQEQRDQMYGSTPAPNANSGNSGSRDGGRTTSNASYQSNYNRDRQENNTSSHTTSAAHATASTHSTTHGISHESRDHQDKIDPTEREGRRPVILDLTGNGIKVTELSQSNRYVDASGDGLQHRMAWASVGNGVLFLDVNNDGAINNKNEFIFTEWDPNATGDLEAIRSVFDSNHDGKLDASDVKFSQFKIEVTNADGSTSVLTLAQAGIASINLTADTTSIELPDGSKITGQTTFTKSDGSTGIIANTVLAAEVAGFAVTQVVSTDGSGNRVVVITCVDSQGAVARVIKSVTSPSGNAITNSYDDNGDGVFDRIQTIAKSTDGAGVKTELVSNSDGGGILANRTLTVTSADGKIVTISRDSHGSAGATTWFDQREVRTTYTDGHRTVQISDLNPDGSTIRSQTTTISADGKTSSEAIDFDGNGSTDVTAAHVIVVNGDGSRVETVNETNGNGSLRDNATLSVSADGKTQTTSTDADGNGVIDSTEITVLTTNGDGSSSSTDTINNGNGTLRSKVINTRSVDALTSTESLDQDGNGTYEQVTSDATVINADGSRLHTVIVNNADGSVREKTVTSLGADKIRSTTQFDQDGNGTWDTTDVVTITSGVKTDVSSAYNADGSLTKRSTAVTTVDGLSTTTAFDLDGNGTTDVITSDVTVFNADLTSTETINVTNANSSLRATTQIDTSATGLSVTTQRDIDGNGGFDLRTTDVRVLSGDGSWTQTVSERSFNATLMQQTVVSTSADRLTTSVSLDSNGDGAVDRLTTHAVSQNGTFTDTISRKNFDGTLVSKIITSTSDDGLVMTSQLDADGDGVVETNLSDVTTLNADGSRTQVAEIRNASPTSLRSRSTTITSDDGLSVTQQIDSNGDNVNELVRTSVTVLNTNGSETTTISENNANGSLRDRAAIIVSDDGFVTTTQSDINGDGAWDFVSTDTTVLGNDGSVSNTVNYQLNSGPLLWQTVRTSSDDGRSISNSQDVNGDGHFDIIQTRIVASNGDVTTTNSDFSATGLLQARTTNIISDDGLVASIAHDFNGDSVVDSKVTSTTTLNADGSKTTTVVEQSGNGSLIDSTVTTESGSGLSATVTNDFNGDGVIDLTTARTRALAVTGVWTDETVVKNQNLSLNSKVTTTTSADQRNIATVTDRDGNTVADQIDTRTVANNGDVKLVSNLYSISGTLVASFQTTTSADGLLSTTSSDNNGDGRAELTSTDATVLNQNDGSTRTQEVYSGNNRLLGKQVVSISDDGLTRLSNFDVNGDGLFDSLTRDISIMAGNGNITREIETRDGSNLLLSQSTFVTTGNGLNWTLTTDYNGDGGIDRNTEYAMQSDRSTFSTTELFDTQNNLLETSVQAVSADGRYQLLQRDMNGDGHSDRFLTREIDLSRNVKETYWNVELDGSVQSRIVKDVSATGLNASFKYDFDANGQMDLTRITTVSYDANGNEITSYTETFGVSTLAYNEVVTQAANGFSTITKIDFNGDTIIDETRTDTTTILAAGGRVITSNTLYSDGSLREKSVSTVSADERSLTWTDDKDGNGIVDQLITRQVTAAGETVEISSERNQSGYEISRMVTTTSADGLLTTIARSTGATETIIRNPVSEGSYTWNNGVVSSLTGTNLVSSHVVDANGIDTWTSTSDYYAQNYEWVTHPAGGGETREEWELVTHQYIIVSTFRLDVAAESRILAMAGRIYDTLLDRDMSRAEREFVVSFLVNGELNKDGLTTSLMASAEFTTKYGTVSNSELLSQIYKNALDRAPSMAELDQGLAAIAAGTATIASLSIAISDSDEHLFAGNGHAETNNHSATNNNDLPQLATVFDRLLDREEAEAVVERLVDTVFDRAPTANELALLTDKLLHGTEQLDDLVALLRLESAYGPGSIGGYTGTALVDKIYLNTLGRSASAEELAAWSGHISAGRITENQFIAALSESADHLAKGNSHVPVTPVSPSILTGTTGVDTLTGGPTNNQISGLAGNDTINGGAASDLIIGGTGNDTLNGGTGSDTYQWTTGDGSDTIYDTGTSLAESDTLALTNVASTGVVLTHVGNDLKVTIGSEILTFTNRFYAATTAYGIEAITFSNGVTWTLKDILANTTTLGTSAAETLTGSHMTDNLIGLSGNDTLNGNNGDDRLVGGTGVDTMNGGNGNDRYEWAVGDGSDTIYDQGASITETDSLVLTNVASTGVVLTRVGNNLLVTIGSEVLTFTNRFYGPASGFGIETISFNDGITWSLQDILAKTTTNGTSAAETVSGSIYSDNLLGFAGNDTLNGSDGDDRLIGGIGVDTMNGGNGNDRYEWSIGDGSDTIYDQATSLTETDTLVFTNVTSTGAQFTHVGNNLLITIGGEVLTITNRFYSATGGYGVESVSFSDGVVWDLAGILSHTATNGTSAADSLSGSHMVDNIYGFAGNDTLTGNNGDDTLVGGTGVDTMNGGNGNDRYEWATGDGSDTISDSATAMDEVDTLVLTNVAYNAAVLSRATNDLKITMGAEIITITNQFYNSAYGYGVEMVKFSDGVSLQLANAAVSSMTTTGTAVANTLSGWTFADVLYGLAGADTINGNNGDDVLVGGADVDTMNGGNGDDRYIWSIGDGSDTISDGGTSLTETDTLELTNVASTGVVLTRVGNDLKVAIGSEILTFSNRYYASTTGYGIEAISFSDGVIWTLQDILTHATFTGTAAADNLSGSHMLDNIYGLGGNDTIVGNNGDDTIVGGVGIDTLNGANGSDQYIWSTGDGSDIISDNGVSLTETDTLVLSNVNSMGAVLTHVGNDLYVAIGAETLTFTNQFYAITHGYGIEAITFSDGVVWNSQDILQKTATNGTTGADTLAGSNFADNIYGFDGNDTLNGNNGDDVIIGGAGSDTLQGGAGNDTYIWSTGDGSDTLYDNSQSLTETDTLKLTNVASTGVQLTRSGNNIIINFASPSDSITVTNILYHPAYGYGLESIIFSDGVQWNQSDIFAHTKTFGTAAADSISGTQIAGDNIYGLDGNDTISGNNGDDMLIGGKGADTLNGGNDVDTASYETATQGVSVDLAVATAQTGVAGGDEVGDILAAIENLRGSALGDTLLGSASANTVWGGAGNDIVYGRDGYDMLYGEDGNDDLSGGTGADVIDGGAGVDVARYYESASGVSVNLATGLGLSGDAEGDILANIENIYGSNNGADTLTGDANSNTLWGFAGNDVINGGLGNDILSGGSGNDTFRFTDVQFGNDQVSDFEDGSDKLSFVSAVATSYSDFTFSGNGTTDVTVTHGIDSISVHSLTNITLAADDFTFF